MALVENQDSSPIEGVLYIQRVLERLDGRIAVVTGDSIQAALSLCRQRYLELANEEK